jgi:hypothetical protein
MTPELPEITTDLGMTQEEYNSLPDSKYITIPPGLDGQERAGDSIRLDVEAGMPMWKQPGTSMVIMLTILSSGIEKGKTIEWFAGVSKESMQINKRAFKAFGVESKVIVNGKVNWMALTGARANAKFKRELSNQGNMRTVLDSTAFLPVGSKTADTKPAEPLF